MKTDRIDPVFYHTREQRLMFIEVKRLSDNRLYPQNNSQSGTTDAEVIDQLNRYRTRLNNERHEINVQYNNVISYYNVLSNGTLPFTENF